MAKELLINSKVFLLSVSAFMVAWLVGFEVVSKDFFFGFFFFDIISFIKFSSINHGYQNPTEFS